MAIKAYSFRYPFNLTHVFQPWYKYLRDGYDKVVADLTERDRLLEDHLNLGVPQGRLGYVIITASQAVVVGTEVDITGLTLTVTVPANRVLRITGQTIFNVTNAQLVGWVNEDGVNVGAFGDLSNAAGAETIQSGSVIVTPTAGTHIYKLRAQAIGVGTTTIGASAAAPGFILIEDIGPVDRS